jgi:hypothetical protein
VIAAAVAAAGSTRRAARASGIAEPTLRRLLRGHNRFTEQTAARLLRWLPRDSRNTLEVCCNRREIQALSSEESFRLLKMLGSFSRLAALGGPTSRARARESLYATLSRLKEIRLRFNVFENDLTSRGLGVSAKGLRFMDLRAQLAYERVLGPLLDGEATGGVEPTAQELAGHKVRQRPTGRDNPRRKGGGGRPSRLHRFLDLGMKRELILLDQGAWENRIEQKAAARKATDIRVKALELLLLKGLAPPSTPLMPQLPTAT